LGDAASLRFRGEADYEPCGEKEKQGRSHSEGIGMTFKTHDKYFMGNGNDLCEEISPDSDQNGCG
jgi:hypothetical protein